MILKLEQKSRSWMDIGIREICICQKPEGNSCIRSLVIQPEDENIKKLIQLTRLDSHNGIHESGRRSYSSILNPHIRKRTQLSILLLFTYSWLSCCTPHLSSAWLGETIKYLIPSQCETLVLLNFEANMPSCLELKIIPRSSLLQYR